MPSMRKGEFQLQRERKMVCVVNRSIQPSPSSIVNRDVWIDIPRCSQNVTQKDTAASRFGELAVLLAWYVLMFFFNSGCCCSSGRPVERCVGRRELETTDCVAVARTECARATNRLPVTPVRRGCYWDGVAPTTTTVAVDPPCPPPTRHGR